MEELFKFSYLLYDFIVKIMIGEKRNVYYKVITHPRMRSPDRRYWKRFLMTRNHLNEKNHRMVRCSVLRSLRMQNSFIDELRSQGNCLFFPKSLSRCDTERERCPLSDIRCIFSFYYELEQLKEDYLTYTNDLYINQE